MLWQGEALLSDSPQWPNFFARLCRGNAHPCSSILSFSIISSVPPTPSLWVEGFLPHCWEPRKWHLVFTVQFRRGLFNSHKKTALRFSMQPESWKGDRTLGHLLPHRGWPVRPGVTALWGSGSLSRGKTVPFCALKYRSRLNSLDHRLPTTHLQSLGRR